MRSVTIADSEAPPSNAHELLGQLLAVSARQQRSLESVLVELGALSREVGQFGRQLADDQKARQETAAQASKATSNRMAGLLGALFVLWQEASPFIHELWRMLHK